MLLTASAALLGGIQSGQVHQVSILALCCARTVINPSGTCNSG